MVIVVGSENRTKVEAVQQAVSLYDCFTMHDVVSVSVDSEVPLQPLTEADGLRGARNRALYAFQRHRNSVFGVGLEGALIEVPFTRTGRLEVTYCFVYDGVNYGPLGTTNGFEHPKEVIDYVLAHSCDVSTAYRECGLTSEDKIGDHDGSVGYMTHGRMRRTEYNRHAVLMALTHLLTQNRQ